MNGRTGTRKATNRMIECIEKLKIDWFLKFLIEVGALIVLIVCVVIAALLLIAEDQVKERGKKK